MKLSLSRSAKLFISREFYLIRSIDLNITETHSVFFITLFLPDVFIQRFHCFLFLFFVFPFQLLTLHELLGLSSFLTKSFQKEKGSFPRRAGCWRGHRAAFPGSKVSPGAVGPGCGSCCLLQPGDPPGAPPPPAGRM